MKSRIELKIFVQLFHRWKRVLSDMIIIMVISILSAVIVNELRTDSIPLLPPYLDDGFYHKMSLSVFRQGEFKNFRGFIFDARPHKFYEKNHLTGALNFPVSEFDFFYHLYLTDASRDIPIFVYGRTLSHAHDLELSYCLYLKGHKNVTVIF